MFEVIKSCKIHGLLEKNEIIKKGKTNNGKQLYRCKHCHKISRDKFNSNNYENRIKSHRKSRYKQYDLKIRWETIKRKFNISKEQYEKMLDDQDHLCAICKNPEKIQSKKGRGRSEYLAVDHCHITKKVRKLLCRRCNLALGSFNDSITLLEAAIAYLKHF